MADRGMSRMNSELEYIYSQIPQSTCEANCGKCCGPVFPSLAELRNIKQWCTIRYIEYKDFLDITADGSCPYLTNEHKCLIYPVRPFLCRILGASVDLPCPIGKCHASKLLNHPQSNVLYAAIYLHGKEKSRTEKHRRIIRQVFEAINA